ncbi:MAG TPA: trigger factor, partial [Gammaproteobacteria bacterium]|nr:trigger factor [Gammaproteobacteria bacterium]
MQVSVESPSSIERQMTVQVPAERVSEAVDARLKSLRGRVRINGFRPGKVPLKIVKQQYGASVFQDVLSEMLQSSFQEAVAQEKLQPAGAPTIEPINVKQGEPLEYKATFEVYPEIEVADVSSLEVTRYGADIEESDIDKMIENLRKQRQTWEPVE